MSRIDVVRAFFHALAEGDVERALRVSVSNVVVEGPRHSPLSRAEIIAAATGLAAAMDDLHYEVTDADDAGGLVTATLRVSGTHVRPLVLPLAEVQVVQPDFARHELAPQRIVVSLTEGKVATVSTPDPEGPGVFGFFAQEGVELTPPGIMG